MRRPPGSFGSILLVALAGCLSTTPDDQQDASGRPAARLLSVSLNRSSLTGVRRWRWDEKVLSPVPEWGGPGGQVGRCAAVYLVGEDPTAISIDLDLSAPPGFVRASFESSSTMTLGTSAVVPVGPAALHYKIPFPNPNLPAVGAAEGMLVVRFARETRDPFSDLAAIPLKIYGILGTPGLPWAASPDSEENPHAPWLRALDVATRWARGARTRDEAAGLITDAVFELGATGKGPRLRWDRGHPHFCSEYSLQPAQNTVSVDRFFLSDFLDALERDGPAQPVNCSDAATAVYALANLLGCNLTLMTLRIDRAKTHEVSFRLRPVRPMGSSGVVEDLSLTFHQVAWSGGPDRGGLVYDPCVAFPAEGRLLPVCGLRFGDAAEEWSYVARLTPDAAAILLRQTEQRSIAPLRLEELPPLRRQH